MEAAEVKLELHGHEESIDSIRGTFSRQTTRLTKKEAAVKESRREWEAEDDAYKASRAEHEAEVTAHSEALLAHDKLLSQIKAEVSVAKQLTAVVAKDVVSNGTNNNEDVNEEVGIAQAEVLECEAAADEANEILMAARAHIDDLVEEISSIDVRLPILEAEKKQAASKRDFKAAGKASKTIKEMIARKDVCEEELNGDAIDRQANAQKEVDECSIALNKKKEILHEKEKEGGRQRMIALVKKIIKLEQIREDVCVFNDEGVEDGNESISVIGGFVIDSEIAALVSEGEDLDAKFGGWNEIMMECADMDIDSSVEKEVNTDEKESEEEMKDNGEIVEEMHENEVISEEEMMQTQQEEDSCTEDLNEDSDTDNDHQAQKEKSLKRYREIMLQIELMESEIESAIEEEDYDKAADLDENILSLKEEQKSLGITESDLSADDSKESSQCTEKSYTMVSNDAEEIDSTGNIDDLDEDNENDEVDKVEMVDGDIHEVEDDSS